MSGNCFILNSHTCTCPWLNMIEHAIVPDEWIWALHLDPITVFPRYFWWIWAPRNRQEQQYSEHLSHTWHMPCPSLSLGWNLDGLAKLAPGSVHTPSNQCTSCKKWIWTLFYRWICKGVTVDAWCVALLLASPIGSDGHSPFSCWTVPPFVLTRPPRVPCLRSPLPCCQSGIFQLGWYIQILFSRYIFLSNFFSCK